MKSILTTTVFCFITYLSIAQNVGIGTTTPNNKLEVAGSLLVKQPTYTSNATPTAAQQYTIQNGSSASINSADSVFKIYSPGAPSGNYAPSLLGYNSYGFSFSTIGIQVTALAMDLSAGDSLIITDNNDKRLLAVGNGYYTLGIFSFNTNVIKVYFKSNSDIFVGAGFSLLCKAIFSNAINNGISNAVGNCLGFDTKLGSLSSGNANTASGSNSTAMGYSTTVSGNNSIAMGNVTTASGNNSTAMGYSTTASGEASTAMGGESKASGYVSTAMGGGKATGNYSTAMGSGTYARGDYSTAMGAATYASGYGSTAMGDYTTASGGQSTAMGDHTTASGRSSIAMGTQANAAGDYSFVAGTSLTDNGFKGNCILGDSDPTSQGVVGSAFNDQMIARFNNGYYFLTSGNTFALRTGMVAGNGANSWAQISDSTKKEKIIPVNGEAFLQKIAKFKLSSWNYKGQSPQQFRHYGPMAQDFYNAFGHDALGNIGCDTLIYQSDFLGVNFIAIQALEKRTQKIEQQQKLIIDLQQQNKKLITNNQTLEAKLEALTTALNKLNSQVQTIASENKKNNSTIGYAKTP